ncbi:hypothetical protein Ais01nite_74450 [Asanoa ishikariensis]|nr:hypothetical protein Ais01nite_74450 [Asanoa ishikariensis]
MGSLPDRRLKRAEDHEAMVRQLLAACRIREAKARLDAQKAEEREFEAMAGRGNLAASLYAAAQSPGHDCPLVQIARRAYVAEWAGQNEKIRSGDWNDDQGQSTSRQHHF